MPSEKAKFSISFVLLVTFCFAVAFACVLVPGGYFVFAPLGIICLLGVAVVRLALGSLRSSSRRSVRCNWRLFAASACLVMAVALFIPWLGLAVTSFREHQLASAQERRISGLQKPERLRDAAIELHSELMTLPPQDRILGGDSSQLPPVIAKLRPLTVEARDDRLFIKLSQNRAGFFGILAYPSPVDVQHGDEEIIERLWYWETP